MGIPCLGLNGGPAFKHSEAFSFQVATADQAETDRYWNAIVGNGGQESACGWCKDKWGLSWQITPIALTKAVTDPDRAAAKRAFEAMMTMKKIDIAAIEAAHRRDEAGAGCAFRMPPDVRYCGRRRPHAASSFPQSPGWYVTALLSGVKVDAAKCRHFP